MEDQDSQEAIRCAGYLKALADPFRLRAVRALQAGALSVSDIALLLEIDLANASHHLRVLFNAGLVKTEREGKYIYYSLTEHLNLARGKSTGPSLDFGCCKLDLRTTGSGKTTSGS